MFGEALERVEVLSVVHRVNALWVFIDYKIFR